MEAVVRRSRPAEQYVGRAFSTFPETATALVKPPPDAEEGITQRSRVYGADNVLRNTAIYRNHYDRHVMPST